MKIKFKLSAAFFCIATLLFSCTKDASIPPATVINNNPDLPSAAPKPVEIKAYIVMISANADTVQSNVVVVK
jgi:hypothetical protein